MSSQITLYSTGCPKCLVLRSKLDAKQIPYVVVTDVDVMQQLGIERVPVLAVDGKLLDFSAAINWLKDLKNGH